MFSDKRRRFLQTAAGAGMACSTNLLLGRSSFAQSSPAASSDVTRIYIDSRRTISPIDPNLFGSFLEHLGRAIYEGKLDFAQALKVAAGEG